MSGSVEPAPLSVTTEFVALFVWAAPALAVGAPLGLTVMSTVSGGLDRWAVEASVTTNEKCRTDGATTTGAVNVGFCAVALDRVTWSGSPESSGAPRPSTWVQA